MRKLLAVQRVCRPPAFGLLINDGTEINSRVKTAIEQEEPQQA